MTDQIPENLNNQYKHIDFGNYELFAVVLEPSSGGLESNHYKFKHQFKENLGMSDSACRRGYVANYKLTKDKRLILISVKYLTSYFDVAYDKVNETLVGDFFLEMRIPLDYNIFYVPFRKGIMETDKTEWVNYTDDFDTPIFKLDE